MPTYYIGRTYTIVHTDDADKSLPEAERHAPLACKAQLRRLTERLADIGTLRSPDQFNAEDDGFYAIKARCGLRGYGWFSKLHKGVFIVSHYICKKKSKLAKKDKDRMKRNRKILGEDDNG